VVIGRAAVARAGLERGRPHVKLAREVPVRAPGLRHRIPRWRVKPEDQSHRRLTCRPLGPRSP